jgi:hypothetical protein
VLTLALATLFLLKPITHEGGRYRFQQRYLLLTLPLLFGLLASLFVRLLTTQTDNYSFTDTAIQQWTTFPFLRYATGWLTAYGPILVVILFGIKGSIRFLLRHAHLLVYLLLIASLSYIGGTNIEKFALWAMPVILVLIGRTLQENLVIMKSTFLIAYIVVAQCLSQRIFWVLPDPQLATDTPFPILSLQGNSVPYFQLWSYFSSREIVVTQFIEYTVVAGFLLLWMSYRSKRLRSTPSTEAAISRMTEA